jgi:hypothetical protein
MFARYIRRSLGSIRQRLRGEVFALSVVPILLRHQRWLCL